MRGPISFGGAVTIGTVGAAAEGTSFTTRLRRMARKRNKVRRAVRRLAFESTFGPRRKVPPLKEGFSCQARIEHMTTSGSTKRKRPADAGNHARPFVYERALARDPTQPVLFFFFLLLACAPESTRMQIANAGRREPVDRASRSTRKTPIAGAARRVVCGQSRISDRAIACDRGPWNWRRRRPSGPQLLPNSRNS